MTSAPGTKWWGASHPAITLIAAQFVFSWALIQGNASDTRPTHRKKENFHNSLFAFIRFDDSWLRPLRCCTHQEISSRSDRWTRRQSHKRETKNHRSCTLYCLLKRIGSFGMNFGNSRAQFCCCTKKLAESKKKSRKLRADLCQIFCAAWEAVRAINAWKEQQKTVECLFLRTKILSKSSASVQWLRYVFVCSASGRFWRTLLSEAFRKSEAGRSSRQRSAESIRHSADPFVDLQAPVNHNLINQPAAEFAWLMAECCNLASPHKLQVEPRALGRAWVVCGVLFDFLFRMAESRDDAKKKLSWVW